MSYVAVAGARQQRFAGFGSLVASVGARQQRFAGVDANSEAAFAELDSYGQQTSAGAAGPSVAPNPNPLGPPPVGSPMMTSGTDGTTSGDFSSWFPGFATSVVNAGAAVAVAAIDANSGKPGQAVVVAPLPPPETTILGIPAPLAVLGGVLFLLTR